MSAPPAPASHLRAALVGATAASVWAGALAGCGAGVPANGAKVAAVGAESQYANVISQIGGRYVSVTSIIDNPNTDPHEFETSARVAEEVSQARLIVQNGAGYDTFMNKIEQGAHPVGRKVVVAQQVLRLPSSVQNPHLWYDPRTMPAVANVVAGDLARLSPAHRSYFQANVRRFDGSLAKWRSQLSGLRVAHGGVPVAVTEPVADYMLQAAGAHILTPVSLQLAIMDGTDPSPQDISREDQLLSARRVKVFLYNEQVIDSLTQDFLNVAKKHRVPVVAVYETMPVPGYTYQSWMQAETRALAKAITAGASTGRL